MSEGMPHPPTKSLGDAQLSEAEILQPADLDYHGWRLQMTRRRSFPTNPSGSWGRESRASSLPWLSF